MTMTANDFSMTKDVLCKLFRSRERRCASPYRHSIRICQNCYWGYNNTKSGFYSRKEDDTNEVIVDTTNYSYSEVLDVSMELAADRGVTLVWFA